MPRIVVAEDEEKVRATLKRALTRAGYEVLEASNGRQCLELLRGTPVDLLVLDIFMPQLDGIEVIARMRQEFERVPILAISGGGTVAQDQALDVASRFGAARTLAKPFQEAVLLSAVRELLGEA